MPDAVSNDTLIAEETAFIAAQVAEDSPAPAVEVVKPADDPAPVPESAVEEVPPQAEATPAGEAVDEPAAEDEEDVEITDEAFAAAMAAERVSLNLDTVPEAARPIVQKKMKDLEAGFTRTMQKVREGQRAAMAVKAEQRFQTERPDDYIVTMLMSQPDLMDRVNAKLNELEASPTAREAHGVVVERAREKARAAEQATLDKADADSKRAGDIVRQGKAAARAAGVPWEAGVESEIAAHLALNSDISEADIRAIAADKAKVWKKALREQGRNKANDYVAAKVTDRKTAGLAVRPATGATPTPAPRPVPKNDDEFIAQMVARG